jgi:hypothetical protein
MTWARLDDRFHDNRKIKRAWRRAPAAVGLHVMAITYSAGHLTDGFVDPDFVEDRIPVKKQRDRVLSVLLDAGLWKAVDNGWELNDFSDYNPSKAEILARKEAKAAAGRKGAQSRWSPMAGAIDDDGSSHDDGMQVPYPSHMAAMRIDAPDPTRPVIKDSSSRAERERKERDKASDDDRRLCRLLAEQVKERNPKAKVAKDVTWLRSMRLLRESDGNSPDEIETLIRWLFTDPGDDANFWAATIQSASGLRKHFGQVWAKKQAAGRGAQNGRAPSESTEAYIARRSAA